MERMDGSITSSYGDGTREDFLFTYSDEEKEQHALDRLNASLVLNPEFIPVYPKMLQEGYSLIEATVYGFIKFFLSNNSKFFCTDEQLAEMLGCGERSISKAIKKLKDDGLINLTHRIRAGGGKIRFISLVPRCEIHSSKMGNSQGIENKIIENKKIYIQRGEVGNSPLGLALDEFVEMRKKIKKPLTSQALKRLSSKLDKLANNDEEKIAILNQSVDHCWQDVYPLKEPLSTEPKTALDFVQFFDKCWEEGSHKTKILDVYGREKYEKIKSLWVAWCATGNVDDSFSL